MTFDSRPFEDDPSSLTVPARSASYPRGLLARIRDGMPHGKPAWSAAAADEVIGMLSAAGAAITEGQMLLAIGQDVEPLPTPRGGAPETEVLLTGPGPSSWRCRRDQGERWPDYVERCATTARVNVAKLVAGAELEAGGELLVDFAWTTEDEVSLLDLPGYVRDAIRQGATDGRPPWGIYNRARVSDGERVRFAGPVRGTFYGLTATSLAGIPRDARYLDLSGRAKDFEKLHEFHSLTGLTVSDVTEKGLHVIGALPTLRFLTLYSIRARHLEPLGGLRRLELLDCRDATRVTDVTALADLERLRVLSIDVTGLKELSQLGTLIQLRGLEILGGLIRLPTLEPVSGLRELRYLTVGNVRIADQSLRPLTVLAKLQVVDLIHNRFPLAELAELAAALPNTEGPHRAAFVYNGLLGPLLPCKRCKRSRAQMTLGKPSRALCPECDADRLRKHVARWEILVSAAKARRGGTAPNEGDAT